MLPRKGYPLVIVLFLAAVLVTGRFRLALDAIVEPFRNGFEEIIYLPRGDAMKVIAAGFDTPLADALYIKGLIFFSTNVLHRLNYIDEGGQHAVADVDRVAQGRDYTYELFDIVTDLNPRFIRAYQMGAFSLSASRSLKSNMNSVQLLDKGIREYDALETRGDVVPMDPRWLFHLMAATTYEVSISSRLRTAGDIAGSARAKERAEEEFLLAAKSPGAPYFVSIAAVGYQDGTRGGDLLNTKLAMLSVWQELHQEAVRRQDDAMADEFAARIELDMTLVQNVIATRELQELLGVAGQRFIERYGRPPAMPGDLVGAGLVTAIPYTLPLDNEESLDMLLALPDGRFASRSLAAMETRQYLDYLMRALISYQRANEGQHAEDLESLVREGFIPELRPLPLEILGQTYDYDASLGVVSAPLPEYLF